MNKDAAGTEDDGDSATLALVLPVVERVRGAVEAENRELLEFRVSDYQAHNERKSHGLLELNRLQSVLSKVRAHPAARAALLGLSAELTANRRLLLSQLRAAQTVSGIVARAIRDGQSDGTYSAQAWRENEA